MDSYGILHVHVYVMNICFALDGLSLLRCCDAVFSGLSWDLDSEGLKAFAEQVGEAAESGRRDALCPTVTEAVFDLLLCMYKIFILKVHR